MRNMSMKKNEMPAQDPNVRIGNFHEVALGYTEEQAIDEAKRCLDCKHKPCVSGCPVGIDIPAFLQERLKVNFEAAYEIINRSILYRRLRQSLSTESQCERVVFAPSRVSCSQSAGWSVLLLIIIMNENTKIIEKRNQMVIKSL